MKRDLQQALAHVLWIGGGTDAGKTTVAEAIVKRHGLQYYNFDRNETIVLVEEHLDPFLKQ